jgi:hypothetical protein
MSAPRPSRPQPVVPGTPEFDKLYPAPLRTAVLYLFVGGACMSIAELNVAYPALFYVFSVTAGLLGLPNAIAALRVALSKR